jgi:hypothetical protein
MAIRLPHQLFLLVALVAVSLASSRPSHAQFELPDWQPAVAINADLPESIRVYAFTASNPNRRAWLIRADVSDTTWQLRTVMSTASGGAETVTSFANRFEAHVAINGGYFGGGSSYSLVVDQGRVLSPNIQALVRNSITYYPTRGAFAQLNDDQLDVAWVYTVGGIPYAYPTPNPNRSGSPAPQPSASHPEGGSAWPAYNAIGGGPMLVMDGEIDLTWEEEVFFGGSGIDLTSRRARTAIGVGEDGHMIILIWSESNSTGITLGEAAQVMLDAGAVKAVNLDGGGSTNLTAAGSTLLETGRAVVSALVLAPAQDNGPVGEEVIFDTGDACCYHETGEWFASANTPFWGDTPSRLVATGDGSARAVFTLNDIEPGRYEMSAWWVASFNRATNTPFRVYSGGEETTVRVDQTPASTLNQWNVLGSFDLAPGDSIVVDNDATGNTSPSYVNVDAIRLVMLAGTSTEQPQRLTSGLAVYPNPTSARVRIEWGVRQAPAVLRVVDLLGRDVYRANLPAGIQTHTVDVSELASGVYGVEILCRNRVERSTFVVTR